MPKIGDLVGAAKLRPVMKKTDLSIELVPDRAAVRISGIYNGFRRAKVFVGKPIWELANGVTIRTAIPQA